MCDLHTLVTVSSHKHRDALPVKHYFQLVVFSIHVRCKVGTDAAAGHLQNKHAAFSQLSCWVLFVCSEFEHTRTHTRTHTHTHTRVQVCVHRCTHIDV